MTAPSTATTTADPWSSIEHDEQRCVHLRQGRAGTALILYRRFCRLNALASREVMIWQRRRHDEDGDGVSCYTAAADKCREVTIWQRRLLPVEADDDGDGVRCCTAAANECQPSDPTTIATVALRDYNHC